MKRKRVLGTLLTLASPLVLLLGGCLPPTDTDGATTTGTSGAAGQSEDQAQAAGGTTAASPPRALGPEWYTDSDGNHVPDFIEVEKGYDPLVDDCAAEECPGAAAGYGVEFAVKDRNALLILDSSGSMSADAGGGQTRMEAAKKAIGRYAGVSSVYFETGFSVFGHTGDNSEAGKAQSCGDASEVLLPLGAVDAASFAGILPRLQPTGWTPIDGALREAKSTFAGKEGAVNRVTLVSDGIETCGGDPVAAARELNSSGIQVRVDVVGFGVPSDDSRQLRDIAAAGGGEYVDARTGADLDTFFRQQSDAIDQTRAAYNCWARNSSFDGDCDSLLCVTTTAFRIPEEREKYKSGSPESEELTAISRQITDGWEMRQDARLELGKRTKEIAAELERLEKEYRRVYDATYR